VLSRHDGVRMAGMSPLVRELAYTPVGPASKPGVPR
jgi:hypothetical protein